MSDRIAILNDGSIEQVGTPDEVYESPKNVFVAKFIGNPNINMFKAEVLNVSDKNIEVGIGDDRLQFQAPSGTVSTDETVIVGVRPQNVSIHQSQEDNEIECELDLIERIDDRAHATLHAAIGEIRAVIPTGTGLEEGETVYARPNPQELYLFNSGNKKLICKSGGKAVNTVSN